MPGGGGGGAFTNKDYNFNLSMFPKVWDKINHQFPNISGAADIW